MTDRHFSGGAIWVARGIPNAVGSGLSVDGCVGKWWEGDYNSKAEMQGSHAEAVGATETIRYEACVQSNFLVIGASLGAIRSSYRAAQKLIDFTHCNDSISCL